MAATNTSTIGREMSMAHEKHIAAMQEDETFVVRCSMEGVRAMGRLGSVTIDADRNNTVHSRKQYDELVRLGIPHEIVSAPASYKPPVVKMHRK